ncbi:guanine nucleotide exchange factor synembryn-domain-containing protein [Phakopsora pachyrhizi]|uniref:Guanine nucleotide exchange factor synembryn-domain-containing protein n=1 Tax=Phakopsora pachyrhizi TaxID=170000 RepID=A0AAV0AF33_PHAPC|nr:guanine nucleotide exchange factor synembryn-domain-containing protein [Phakopsora pachyrhizi]
MQSQIGLSYPSLSPQLRSNNSTARDAFDGLIRCLDECQDGLEPSDRSRWIEALIHDLEPSCSSSRSTWTPVTLYRCLTALKYLGRSPLGTSQLTSHIPLLTRLANLSCSDQLQDSSSTTTTAEDPGSSSPDPTYDSLIVEESLRILANTLFLHPLSRSSPDLLPALDSLVRLAISTTTNQTSHQNATIIFLAARVLFLITAVPSTLAIELVERTAMALDLKQSLKLQVTQTISSDSRPIPPDALIEYLKLIFNVMVQYPRSLSQFSNLSSTSSVPPSQTSGERGLEPDGNDSGLNCLATACGHSPSLRQKLRRFSIKNPIHSLKNKDPTSSHNGASSLDTDDAVYVTEPKNKIFSGLLPYLVQLFLLEPIPDPPVLKSPLISYIHCFLNFSPLALPFLENVYQLPQDFRTDRAIPPLILKLLMIVDRVIKIYDDPDDESIQERCKKDGMDLLDLTHLFLLLTSLITPTDNSDHGITGSSLSESSREALRRMVVPEDIDRTVGLQKQNNFIGRVLRIVNCVSCESLKIAAGGFLYALYDEDGWIWPMAGYFVSIGRFGFESESKNQRTKSTNINPITGTLWSSVDETGGENHMSEEDKEREADRLCSLFDRMNRNGIIKAEDPRRRAVDTGRFEEIEKSLERMEEKEGVEEEEEAMRELQKYRERLKK